MAPRWDSYQVATALGWLSSSIKPELVGLIDALHGIAHDAERRAAYLADRGLCRTLPADPGSARCACRPRPQGDRRDGHPPHPLLPFLARLQVDRSGR